jgi:hypothetical protein
MSGFRLFGMFFALFVFSFDAFGKELSHLDMPNKGVDVVATCTGAEKNIIIPKAWKKNILNVEVSCSQEEKVPPNDEQMQYSVYLKYTLKNSVYFGHKVSVLYIKDAPYSGFQQYLIDKKFTTLKPWLIRNFRKIAEAKERVRLSDGKIDVFESKIYMRTSEIGGVSAFPSSSDYGKTVVSFQWSD